MAEPDLRQLDFRIDELEERLREHAIQSGYARCYAAAAALTAVLPLLPMSIATGDTVWFVAERSVIAQFALALAVLLFGLLVAAAVRPFTSPNAAWTVGGVAAASAVTHWIVADVSDPGGSDLTTATIGGIVLNFMMAILCGIHGRHLRLRRLSLQGT